MNVDRELAGMLAQVHGRVGDLCGSRWAGTRQAIAQLLTGEKLPKSKCGYYAIEAMVFAHVKAPMDRCRAVRFDAVHEWCRANRAQPERPYADALRLNTGE